MRLGILALAALAATLATATFSHALFHLMQIEQVIGGVNGNLAAQAVQLRMRSSNQNVLESTRLVVVNAAGAMPVVVKDFTTIVPVGTSGSRVLITSPAFADYTNAPLMTNFVMDNLIPTSYLAAGQLRFQSDSGDIYWSLSWGGSAYMGTTTGTFDNDANGNFGPPVDLPLPSTGLQALRFTGAATAASTTNLAQYALSASPATFTNNAGASFTLQLPPPEPFFGDFNADGFVDAADYTVWRNHFGTTFDLNGNGDEGGASENTVDEADYMLWRAHYGAAKEMDGGGELASASDLVPEPATWVAAAVFAFLGGRHRRRDIA